MQLSIPVYFTHLKVFLVAITFSVYSSGVMLSCLFYCLLSDALGKWSAGR